MPTIKFALLIALSTFLADVKAQSATPKALFDLGAEAYVKDGASSAIATWLKGSALEGNTQATSQANALRQIEDFYGKPESYEVLSESKVSERSAVILGIINYQKGPLFVRFSVYRLASGAWVTAEFKVHTEIVQLFPESAIYRR